MPKIAELLLSRLKEMTTWLGLVSMATAAGWTFTPEMADAVTAFGTAAAGLVLVIFRERKAS